MMDQRSVEPSDAPCLISTADFIGYQNSAPGSAAHATSRPRPRGHRCRASRAQLRSLCGNTIARRRGLLALSGHMRT